jgi:hypothetical protein
MNYKHLSQIERYQIYSLMKANQSISQIAEQLGSHKSSISRELGLDEGRRGNRPNKACELALVCSQSGRNVLEIEPWGMCQRTCCSYCNGALSRSRASYLSVLIRFICTCMRTKPMAASCGRISAAKRK